MFGFKIIFWYWWALAAVLLVFEMLLPGVVFLFLTIGALASGAFLLVISDLSLELQLLVFAIVSVASAVMLRPTLKRMQQGRPADANLNARGDSLVGKTIVLDTPILGGQGRVKLGERARASRSISAAALGPGRSVTRDGRRRVEDWVSKGLLSEGTTGLCGCPGPVKSLRS